MTSCLNLGKGDTHDLYDQTLADEDDIDNSAEYFSTAERTYIEAVSDAHKFLSPISHDIVSPEPMYNSKMFDLLSLPKLTIDTFTGDPVKA